MANESGTWIMHGVVENDPRCLHTVEEAVTYINEVGFLPLFKNEIPDFSLEERTVPEYWWSGDPKHDPWEWRKLIAGSQKAAYGKFFDKKAGFISKEWFPYFANYRRDGYDFDADFRQRKNKKGEDYGWAIAVYSTPEHLWGYDHVTSAYKEDPMKSWKRIVKRMNDRYPKVTDAQIRRVAGISGEGSMAPGRKSKRTWQKDWIIPANPQYYNVVGAFEESNIVTWKQSSDIHVGDMIYMYVAAPYSAILYKCRAIEVDIPRQYSDDNLTVKTAMSLELLEKFEPGVWTLERIRQFGVYAVRGPRSMPGELKREMMNDEADE